MDTEFNNICCICYAPADAERPLMHRADATNSCKSHLFHYECLSECVKGNTAQCLVCQKPIEMKKVLKMDPHDESVSRIADIQTPFLRDVCSSALRWFEETGVQRPWTDEELLDAIRTIAKQARNEYSFVVEQ